MQTATGCEQLRTRSAMDRAIHTAASEQAFIGRVDDGIHLERRNICLHSFEFHHLSSVAMQERCAGNKRSLYAD